jgi:hypothetical protein
VSFPTLRDLFDEKADDEIGAPYGVIQSAMVPGMWTVLAKAIVEYLDTFSPTPLQNNIDTADPDADNDDTEGYSIFSLWLNESTEEVFIAVDVSTGAAVWASITGTGAGAAKVRKDEDLTSQIDGATQNFSLSEAYDSGTLWVYWNGQKQIRGVTFSETGSTTFSTTFTPLIGQALEVVYQK